MQGLDEEMVQEKEEKVEVKSAEPKQLPYATWDVNGETYKLKLSTAIICKLEEKFKCNLLAVITKGDVPPLWVMLTIIQGAMSKYHHGMSYKKVQDLFDEYQENDGTQLTLFTEVVMSIFAVSGFFSKDQRIKMEENLEEAKAEL